jgi:hypothetical protein
MSAVSPPDIWYDLQLPPSVVENNLLSALQLEAVVYACQRHEQLLPSGLRAGFLIGDGAGVGKGRTVAGVVYENYLLGRKRAIWLSVSNDLHYDAVRDLRDIGCKIKVQPLNKFKYDEKISADVNGRFKKGVIFSTYSSLIGETSIRSKFQTRLDQLVHWFVLILFSFPFFSILNGFCFSLLPHLPLRTSSFYAKTTIIQSTMIRTYTNIEFCLGAGKILMVLLSWMSVTKQKTYCQLEQQ